MFSQITKLKYMKTIAYLLLLGLFVGAPMTFAQDDAAPETTEETAAEPEVDVKALKKEANRYWSTKMARMKKTASALKKVKDKKSAKKATKTIEGLCKKELKKPEDSEYMDAAEKRFLMHIEKLNEQIDEEVERIKGIGDSSNWSAPAEKVMTPELEAAINKVLQ